MRGNSGFIPRLAIGLAALLALAAPPVSAAESNPLEFIFEVPIPGLDRSVTVGNEFFPNYLEAVYVAFVWFVGILATVMVVFGGIKWVAAAGNPARINDARDAINSAIIGVIIALTSVVMLNLISPNLTTFGIPDISKITSKQVSLERISFPTVALCRGLNDPVFNCGETGLVRQDVSGTLTDLTCLGTRCPNMNQICVWNFNQESRQFTAGTCQPALTTTAQESLAVGGVPTPGVGWTHTCGVISTVSQTRRVGTVCNETNIPLCFTINTPSEVLPASAGAPAVSVTAYERLKYRGCADPNQHVFLDERLGS